jgi:hypothetical protein
MAKLVSLIGKPAVSEVCQSHAFAVCKFENRLPIENDSFLWSEDESTGVFNVADEPTKRLLADEQLRFALVIIPRNFRPIVAGASLDVLRQLDHIGLTEYSYRPIELKSFKDRLPARDFVRLKSTLAARSDVYAAFGRIALYVTIISGAIVIILLSLELMRRRTYPGAKDSAQGSIWFGATCILCVGVLMNAVICGAFSAVHDRYESRVIWLIQLSIVTGVFALSPHRRIAWRWKRKSQNKADFRRDYEDRCNWCRLVGLVSAACFSELGHEV